MHSSRFGVQRFEPAGAASDVIQPSADRRHRRHLPLRTSIDKWRFRHGDDYPAERVTIAAVFKVAGNMQRVVERAPPNAMDVISSPVPSISTGRRDHAM
jgi:hypothetical protein